MANLKFYFDEMMPRPVAAAVADRGYEVVMAIDSDMVGKDDDTEHLPFATQNQAVLVTRDRAFAGRAIQNSNHAGLICWTGAQNDIGGMIRALVEFAEQHSPEDVSGHVYWLK